MIKTHSPLETVLWFVLSSQLKKTRNHLDAVEFHCHLLEVFQMQEPAENIWGGQDKEGLMNSVKHILISYGTLCLNCPWGQIYHTEKIYCPQSMRNTTYINGHDHRTELCPLHCATHTWNKYVCMCHKMHMSNLIWYFNFS